VIFDIHESDNAWVYPTVVSLSLLGLFLWPTARKIEPAERPKYAVLQIITLVSAIVGAKLAVLAGDLGWPVTHVSWVEVIRSGRSITGGLALGFVGAEVAKPFLHYALPPNDAFAAKLPFSIALGRVGCTLAGCCRGVPRAGLIGLRYEDGLVRWPAQPLEIVFQLAAGVTFLGLVRRGVARGRVYAIYMIAYGAFRFATEFLRDTPKPVGVFSVYQGISIVLVGLGVSSFVVRGRTASEVRA
jgi:phosphatidylglycerol:prolipoprotein diacylglycerol transferase